MMLNGWTHFVRFSKESGPAADAKRAAATLRSGGQCALPVVSSARGIVRLASGEVSHARALHREQELLLLVVAPLAADARAGHSVRGAPPALRRRGAVAPLSSARARR